MLWIHAVAITSLVAGSSSGHIGRLHTSPATRRTALLRGGAVDDAADGAAAGARPFSFEDRDDDTALVMMPIGEEVSSRDVVYELNPGNPTPTLTLGVKGAQPIICDEPLWGRVLRDDAYWEIDEIGDERCVVLELPKRDYGRWQYLLKSDFKPPDSTVTTKCYLEIEIGGEAAGRRAPRPPPPPTDSSPPHTPPPPTPPPTHTSHPHHQDRAWSLRQPSAKDGCQLPISLRG